MAEQLDLPGMADPLNVLDAFQMYVLTQLIPFGDLRTMREEFEWHQSRDNWPEVDSRTWSDVMEATSFLDYIGEVKALGDTLRRIQHASD